MDLNEEVKDDRTLFDMLCEYYTALMMEKELRIKSR